MVRAGWLATGKMVIYPIRNAIDGDGRQLVNWVAEIETPKHRLWDWNRTGALEDFIAAFDDWHFDWLDVPAMIRSTPEIFEFPMVDKDPLTRWTFGRVTLLGDAAHPMYPRGSNGAVQAILDARCLAACLHTHGCGPAALSDYEQQRRPRTTEIVLANRARPPDIILQKVFERTGDQPFARIDDVISQQELAEISRGYKSLSGFPATRGTP
jgi:2-polyprenyl-6-methoxyphenol hydroxylase-like FAD-dependent oxidoreductase